MIMPEVQTRKYEITMAGGATCQIDGDNVQVTESGALLIGDQRLGFNVSSPMQVRMAFAPGEWLRVHKVQNDEIEGAV